MSTTGATGMGQARSESKGNRSLPSVTDLLHPLGFPLKSKLTYYPL